MMRPEQKDESVSDPKRPRLHGDQYGPSSMSEEPYKPETAGRNVQGLIQSNEDASFACLEDSAISDSGPLSGGAFGGRGGFGPSKLSGSVGSEESQDSGSQSNTPEPSQNEELCDDDGSRASNDDDNDMDDLSELSNLSGLSEETWQPVAGPISWVQRQMVMGQDPRAILQELIPADTEIPEDYDQLKLWKIIINLLSEPPPREKLPNVNTLEDVVELLKKCSNIIVLTGAGVSVSCGIPDFRSRDGIYARLAKDFPNLPDPQSMFDIDFFRQDQRPFFKFAKEIYPGQFEPSRCHKFIKLLESHGKLLRNYTQNIDTLEKVAGIERVIECHGSFATATCMMCKYKVQAEDLRKDIFDQVIPRCPHCAPDTPLAVMKPDIVFFGESLPGEFHRQMASDKNECDLLIVIGSSLKVRPVALIPNSLPAHVPQIIINREPLHKRLTFDVELLGNCDDIISELCKRLGDTWDHLAAPGPLAQQIMYSELPVTPPPPGYPPFDCGGVGPSLDLTSNGKSAGLAEFNADSGLGDVDTVSSTNALKETQKGSSSGLSDERLERFCSSDSGVEAASAQCMSEKTGGGDGVSPCIACESSVTDTAAVSHAQHPEGVSEAISVANTHKVGGSNSDVHSETASADNLPGVSIQGEDSTLKTHDSVLKTDTTTHTDSDSTAKHTHQSRAAEADSTSEAQSPRKRHETRCHGHTHSHDGSEKKMDLDRESQKDNAHCSHTDTIEEIRRMWQPRRRLSLASKVDEEHFIFVPPNRYIFRGAEVYTDDSDSDSDESEAGSPPSTPSQLDETEERTDAVLNTIDEAFGTTEQPNFHENVPLKHQGDSSQPPEASSSNVLPE